MPDLTTHSPHRDMGEKKLYYYEIGRLTGEITNQEHSERTGVKHQERESGELADLAH